MTTTLKQYLIPALAWAASQTSLSANYVEIIPRAPEANLFDLFFEDFEDPQNLLFELMSYDEAKNQIVGQYLPSFEEAAALGTWSLLGGVTPIENPPLINDDYNGFFPVISPDSSTIGAYTLDGLSYLWTEATGWFEIESQVGRDANIQAVSNQAQRSCGEVENEGSPFRQFPAVWDSEGAVELIPIPEAFDQGIAELISADGSTVFGEFHLDFSNRTAFVWNEEDGASVLENPTDWTSLSITSVNADGTLAMGTCNVSSLGNRFFTWTAATGFELISLPSNPERAADARISSDSSIAVLSGTSGFDDRWFIWRPGQTAVAAQDFFKEKGLDNRVFAEISFLSRLEPSASGKVLLGEGETEDFEIISFVVHLDEGTPQIDLNFSGEERQVRWQNLPGWELLQSSNLEPESWQTVTSTLIDGVNVTEPEGDRGFFQLRRLPSQ